MWQQLIVQTSREVAFVISDAMSELGALSVSLSDSEDEPVFDRLDGKAPLWSETTVTGLWSESENLDVVVSSLQEVVGAEAIISIKRKMLAEQDWERVWLDRFEPININDRLWISPVEKEPPAPKLPTIYIDPGLAFGTGTHATTHLCLEWLTSIPLKDVNIIDYGCGSGILAIAAMKLGAARAIGVDTDTRALEVSRENAKDNGVGEHFSAFLPEEVPNDLAAPVVIANILAEPLIELAPAISAMVETGGYLGLSGMLEDQVESVLVHYSSDFELIPRIRDGWALLAGRKR